jgi:hypothetical protein
MTKPRIVDGELKRGHKDENRSRIDRGLPPIYKDEDETKHQGDKIMQLKEDKNVDWLEKAKAAQKGQRFDAAPELKANEPEAKDVSIKSKTEPIEEPESEK